VKIEYYVSSRNPAGHSVVSLDEFGHPLFGVIEVFITAIGCDGKGTPLDYCGIISIRSLFCN
jgi:hypothetical protein